MGRATPAHPPGVLALPAEQALGEQFGVSRITVRRALAALSDQGYVRRRPGRGTFVRERPAAAPPQPVLTHRDALRKCVEAEGFFSRR